MNECCTQPPGSRDRPTQLLRRVVYLLTYAVMGWLAWDVLRGCGIARAFDRLQEFRGAGDKTDDSTEGQGDLGYLCLVQKNG